MSFSYQYKYRVLIHPSGSMDPFQQGQGQGQEDTSDDDSIEVEFEEAMRAAMIGAAVTCARARLLELENRVVQNQDQAEEEAELLERFEEARAGALMIFDLGIEGLHHDATDVLEARQGVKDRAAELWHDIQGHNNTLEQQQQALAARIDTTSQQTTMERLLEAKSSSKLTGGSGGAETAKFELSKLTTRPRGTINSSGSRSLGSGYTVDRNGCYHDSRGRFVSAGEVERAAQHAALRAAEMERQGQEKANFELPELTKAEWGGRRRHGDGSGDDASSAAEGEKEAPAKAKASVRSLGGGNSSSIEEGLAKLADRLVIRGGTGHQGCAKQRGKGEPARAALAARLPGEGEQQQELDRAQAARAEEARWEAQAGLAAEEARAEEAQRQAKRAEARAEEARREAERAGDYSVYGPYVPPSRSGSYANPCLYARPRGTMNSNGSMSLGNGYTVDRNGCYHGSRGCFVSAGEVERAQHAALRAAEMERQRDTPQERRKAWEHLRAEQLAAEAALAPYWEEWKKYRLEKKQLESRPPAATASDPVTSPTSAPAPDDQPAAATASSAITSASDAPEPEPPVDKPAPAAVATPTSKSAGEALDDSAVRAPECA